MKKLVATKPRVANLVEFQSRQLLENEVRVRVIYASPKHGTEIADFRGISPFIDEEYDTKTGLFRLRDEGSRRGIEFGNFELGNQFVGEIIEIGNKVSEYKLGDFVSSYGCISEEHIINGINNYKLRIIDDISKWKNALCYDPAQFALGGIRDGNVRPGDFVVVIGLGAIGLLAIQMASKIGASIVIGVDPIEIRRNLALETGATHCIDSSIDVGMTIKKLTKNIGADVVIETSGNVFALQSALRGLAYNGVVSYVAFAKEFPAGLTLGREAHFNNAKIVFSRAANEPNHDYPRWNRKRIEDTCWEMLMSDYLDCSKIIYPVVDFNEVASAYMKYVDLEPDLSVKLGVKVGVENV